MPIYFKYILSSILSKNKNGAFTLVELLVVMSIATVIMTALIIQQSKWNDRLIVSTQAYELALMIRQAQIYSLGVREDTAGSGDKFNIGYGISVDEDNYNQYIFFADRNNNKKYDSGEAIEIKTFTRGVLINRFCGVKSTGQHEDRCSPDNGNVHKLNITFFRPEPKANILLLNNGGNQSNNIIPPAKIYLQSPGGKQYSMNVEANGQISVVQI